MKNDKILIPYSDAVNKEVARYAIDLARDRGLGILFLQIIGPYNYYTNGSSNFPAAHTAIHQPPMEEFLQLKQNESVHTIEEMLEPLDYKIDVKHLQLVGNTLNEINDTIDNYNILMVLLSMKIESDLFDKFLGSPKSQIVRSAHCPVFLIPENTDFKPWKSIVYATSTLSEDTEPLKKIAPVCNLFQAKLNIVNIHESLPRPEVSEIQKAILSKKIGYSNIRYFTHYDREQDMAESLQKLSKELNADVVVAQKHNLNFFQRLFSKNVTRELRKESEVPMLVVHEE